MAITSLDILNLSHSLKDICEVNCNTPECLSQTLKILLQYNLIQANLQFGKQFGSVCPLPARAYAAVPHQLPLLWIPLPLPGRLSGWILVTRSWLIMRNRSRVLAESNTVVLRDAVFLPNQASALRQE